MSNKVKGILIIASFLFALLVLMIVDEWSGQKKAAFEDKKYDELVGKVQFKGSVINSHVFEYGGKDYFMICVKLDYTNHKSFYVLNEYCFLKIKNNIATMVVGFLNPDYGIPKYVEINMNNNRIERFHYLDGKIYEAPLTLANFDLTKDAMNLCN